MRGKVPSLADYDPERIRPAVEEVRLNRVFPKDRPIEERVTRAESVLFDAVQEQLRVSPMIEQAHEYVNDETNARFSAVAHARATHNLLVDLKRTQRVSESRSKYYVAVILAVVAVIIVGMWTKTDPTTLITLAGLVGGLATLIVNQLAQKSGKVRDDDTIPPPPPGPPSPGAAS